MVFLILALLFSVSVQAQEYIASFASDITIHKDASMRVRETITVQAEGDAIKRGIVREFPTQYKDRWGNSYNVQFDVTAVLRDGKSSPYHVESASNGKKIYIGSAATYLHPGLYTFTIEYTTNRQLGFFENHDELYWNVTGNGWRFPIKEASATVHLPSTIPADTIKIEAYTGRQNSKQKNYTRHVAEHEAEFATTFPLRQYEGLTIVVGWPKGYVDQPSFLQKLLWFFKDNLSIFILLLGLFLLLIMFWPAYVRVRKDRSDTPIIPLFYPPEDMLPGEIRYFQSMGYDSKVLTAEIVNMAVQGWLTIEHKTGWFGADVYTLKKNKKINDSGLYAEIFDSLFAKKDAIELKKHNEIMQGVVQDVQSHYGEQLDNYFNFNTETMFMGGLIAFGFLLIAFVLFTSEIVLVIGAVTYGLVLLATYFVLKGYTRDGWELSNKIEGFKLFLATTETERLKIIGTPPTRTPELYETYLPYAIALGVEKAWSRQFAPMFEKMAQAGHVYVPIWYGGLGNNHFDAGAFSSDVSGNLNSVISSSSSVPGKSSGFSSGSGGGGSSGGGGGGGGGGGW
ncbi:MAG: DUF2207 domain-containing protein [Candidatus Dependentiae bacterium]|nr:DUF2207 domain-containing protein [Candidatus Dependentiae bacterium]